jgi:ABC-2 type transport system ATP-binding protein
LLSLKDFYAYSFASKKSKKDLSGEPPFLAIEDLSFHLKKGEILGLLGPNGSGKTTTIQMLLGTLSITSGEILYFDKEFTQNRSEILQHVSFASTYTSPPWNLTIAQNLEIFGYLYGLSPKESTKNYTPLLERFGIIDKKDNSVASLSAGQVTRLMLVKAFFIQPQIVLLDEPTASLDPDIASDICSFLLEQRDKMGTSLLFSSHKMSEVMEVCDRTIFLKQGKLVADDLPEKLARSVSAFKVKLVIIDGLKRTIEIANKEGLKHTLEHRLIEVLIDEEKIPSFLHQLSAEKVSYANIKVESLM